MTILQSQKITKGDLERLRMNYYDSKWLEKKKQKKKAKRYGFGLTCSDSEWLILTQNGLKWLEMT